jgi:hypothetical protein
VCIPKVVVVTEPTSASVPGWAARQADDRETHGMDAFQIFIEGVQEGALPVVIFTGAPRSLMARFEKSPRRRMASLSVKGRPPKAPRCRSEDRDSTPNLAVDHQGASGPLGVRFPIHAVQFALESSSRRDAACLEI